MATYYDRVFVGRWEYLSSTINIKGKEYDTTEVLPFLNDDLLYEEIDNECKRMRENGETDDGYMGCLDIEVFEELWRNSSGIEDLPAIYWIAFR